MRKSITIFFCCSVVATSLAQVRQNCEGDRRETSFGKIDRKLVNVARQAEGEDEVKPETDVVSNYQVILRRLRMVK